MRIAQRVNALVTWTSVNLCCDGYLTLRCAFRPLPASEAENAIQGKISRDLIAVVWLFKYLVWKYFCAEVFERSSSLLQIFLSLICLTVCMFTIKLSFVCRVLRPEEALFVLWKHFPTLDKPSEQANSSSERSPVLLSNTHRTVMIALKLFV